MLPSNTSSKGITSCRMYGETCWFWSLYWVTTWVQIHRNSFIVSHGIRQLIIFLAYFQSMSNLSQPHLMYFIWWQERLWFVLIDSYYYSMNNFINFAKKQQRNGLERGILAEIRKTYPHAEQYLSGHRYPTLPKIVVYSASSSSDSFLQRYMSPQWQHFPFLQFDYTLPNCREGRGHCS